MRISTIYTTYHMIKSEREVAMEFLIWNLCFYSLEYVSGNHQLKIKFVFIYVRKGWNAVVRLNFVGWFVCISSSENSIALGSFLQNISAIRFNCMWDTFIRRISISVG